MPRHAQETLTALRVARSAGLKVALVTDLALGPLADEADAVFATGTGSRLVFDSYAAPGVMSAALLQAMTDADPERTQARLEDVRAGRRAAPVLPQGLIPAVPPVTDRPEGTACAASSGILNTAHGSRPGFSGPRMNFSMSLRTRAVYINTARGS